MFDASANHTAGPQHQILLASGTWVSFSGTPTNGGVPLGALLTPTRPRATVKRNPHGLAPSHPSREG